MKIKIKRGEIERAVLFLREKFHEREFDGKELYQAATELVHYGKTDKIFKLLEPMTRTEVMERLQQNTYASNQNS